MAVKGVDISYSNGDMDFGALKAAGIEFVLIRCGYGGNYTNQDDAQFANNIRKAEATGMSYGVYIYSYALNVQAVQSEVEHVLRLLNGCKPAYGVWFDMEDADGYKARHGMPSNATLVDICYEFCKAIEEAGYYTGIYASLSWFNTKLASAKLDRFDKWVAQWASKCSYTKPYGIWQFTDKLVIGGKEFDANYAYKDYPALTGNNHEEEVDMTKEEVIKLAREEAQKVYDENEKKYPTIKSLPAWAKEKVKAVYEELGLTGTGGGSTGEDLKIDASPSYVRVLVVMASLLDKLKKE